MPKATYTNEAVRKELRTCEGGYVELRQLSFDEMLERRDKAMQMSIEQKPGNKSKQETSKVIFESAMQWTRFFEFSHCIVDHNLEDDQGGKLNFGNVMTLKVLDPKIGQEIERYIEEMNQEDDEEELENFTNLLSSSSKTEQSIPSTTTDPG